MGEDRRPLAILAALLVLDLYYNLSPYIFQSGNR